MTTRSALRLFSLAVALTVASSAFAQTILSPAGGEHWQTPPLLIAQFYHVAVDGATPYHVMGAMQDLGTAWGPSNSLVSEGIRVAHWRDVGGGEAGFAVPESRAGCVFPVPPSGSPGSRARHGGGPLPPGGSGSS